MRIKLCLLILLSLLLCPTHLSFAQENRKDSGLNQVKKLMASGDYRQALEEITVILVDSPDDPVVLAYKALCEFRLKEKAAFSPVSSQDLDLLQDSLKKEEQARKLSDSHTKTIKRQIKEEQAKWDEDLKRIHREYLKEQRIKEEKQKREAAAARDLAKKRREEIARIEKEQKATAEALKGAEESLRGRPPITGEVPSELVGKETETGVELAPVRVSTEPAAGAQPAEISKQVPEAKLSPSELGSIQILADELSAIPERNMAVAKGNVRILFQDGQLTCHEVTVFTDTHDVYAQGDVRLERGYDWFTGKTVHYNLDTKKGRIYDGAVFQSPWFQKGEIIEQIAQGIWRVKSGYTTTCEFDPPHYRIEGKEALVLAQEKMARLRGVSAKVSEVPIAYIPWTTVVHGNAPFFAIPGRRKPWGEFLLTGYRHEWPFSHQTTVHADWRRYFGFGTGLDHRFESERFGSGIFKSYYNPQENRNRPLAETPKGADEDRYRVLFRHKWQPFENTNMVTDIQKFSDVDFRKDMLFRDEYVEDDIPESYVSIVRNDSDVALGFLAQKRINRFQDVTEFLPQATVDILPKKIGNTPIYSQTKLGFENIQSQSAHSDINAHVARADWFQQLSYAFNWLRPLMITPKANVRQSYYSRDTTGEKRDFISGQFGAGIDASIKFFGFLPTSANWLGLNLEGLRHVFTPTVSYDYAHASTVPNELLDFPASSDPHNQITFSVDNKLQTKRADESGVLRSVDLVSFLVSVPYSFHGRGSEAGGRLGEWNFDLEMYPWPWLRLESDWKYQSVLSTDDNDGHIPTMNLDLVMTGGRGKPSAKDAPEIQKPWEEELEMNAAHATKLLPVGQWSLGLGHRYSRSDKTEGVIQTNYRISRKWQIGTFNRILWKDVTDSYKRINYFKETQFSLTRDLHDWIARLVYRIDKTSGHEVFFMLTLKAYPKLPIQLETSYRQPKAGYADDLLR